MNFKRILSFLLAILMTISCMSFSTLTAAADDTAEATIQVENEYAVPGSTVTLDVTIQNNPGIVGMTLKVLYDEAAATLVAVENGDCLKDLTFTTPKDLTSGCTLPWDGESVTAENVSDGVIVKLTFEVARTAAAGKKIAVQLTCDPGAIIDNHMTPVPTSFENGGIYVIDYIPGDLNGDGLVNTTDVVFLRRFVAGGYGVEINTSAADVNEDDKINTTDAVYIRRFVAGGYGVTLKPSKHNHVEVIDAAKAPTCTETGLTEGKHCSTCGEVLVKQEVVPAKGHNYVNGICSVCGNKNMDYNGATFTTLYWSDVEHNEFFAEAQTGDVVDDALYMRNMSIEESLNINLSWLGVSGDATDAAGFISFIQQDQLTGAHQFDMIAGYSLTMASAAVNGYLYNLTDTKIEFTQPWWPQTFVEQGMIGNKLCYASGDISMNTLYMMYACFVNEDLLAKYKLENPAELVLNGTWTYDKFIEMCQGVYEDLDANGQKNENDRFGYMTSGIHVDPWFYGTGAVMALQDADGNLQIADSFAGEAVINTIDKINALLYDSLDGLYTSAVRHQQQFRDEHLLFMIDRARTSFKVLNANENCNYMIVPCPKYDKAQENYPTIMGNPFTMYSIPSDSADSARAAAVMETFASKSYEITSPAAAEMIMGEKYDGSSVNGKMFDILRQNFVFDIGRIFANDLIGQGLFRNSISNNRNSWAADVKANQRVLEKKLEILTQAFLKDDSHTHTATNWTVTEPATCEKTGTQTGTCSVCGVTVTQTIEKIDHNYVDGKCTLCGKAGLVDGTVIFEEKFDYPNDSNTTSVLDTIGWTKLTKEANGVYNETDAEFAIVDGRLYYDNWDEAGLPEGDTRIRGKDGYYQINVLDDEYMKPFVAGKYTLQYDLEYVAAKNNSRYANIVTECSADGQCYNSFHFRIGGYGNSQAHFYGSWKTYDLFDPATDLYSTSQAESAEDAAETGTPISYKLIGKYNDKVNDPFMFLNVPITIKQQWEPEMGHHVYMKTADMADFVKVSEPSVSADGPMYVGSWEGYAVQFKLGAAVDGYIDNIKMWIGWADVTEDGHVISDGWTVEKEATCSETGIAVAVCSKCGEKVTRTLPTISHTYTNWTVTKQPTCTEYGEESGACSCGATTTRDVEKTNHVFDGENCVACGRGYNYDLQFTKYTTNSNSYYRVTGIGKCTDTEICIPAMYNDLPVTEISSAFVNKTNITKIIIADGITTISGNAFYGCTSLTELILPETLTTCTTSSFVTSVPAKVFNLDEQGGRYLGTANNPYFLLYSAPNSAKVTDYTPHPDTKFIGYNSFSNRDYLQSITIPEGVEIISYFTFNNCDSLKSISFPSTATNMGYNFFGGSPMLESVTVHADNPVYKSVNNCIINKNNNTLQIGCVSSVIPDDGSITAIGNCAFQSVPLKGSLVIPEGVSSIVSWAFRYCDGLTEIVLPSTLVKMGNNPFAGCDSLTSITVAEGNTSFYVVDNCLIQMAGDALMLAATNEIPDCVKAIGPYAFYAMGSLGSIDIPESVTSIGNYAFYDCTNLADVTIPDSVKTIGNYAFYNCAKLDNITIPDSVTSIGTYAFYGCSNLTEIAIPEGVTAINNYTFRNCSKLTTISIPVSVTKIGNYAFFGCNALTTIYYPGTIDQWKSITVGSNNTPLTSLEPISHNYTNWVVTVAPTCTQTGLETGTCECGATTTRVIPTIAHNYVDNICSACGRTMTSEGLSYTLSGSGTYYTVKSLGTCADTEIVIPDTHEGIPVQGIGKSAFSGATHITKIVIPDGVQSIDAGAFTKCSALTEIVLPNTLVSIDSSAFDGVSNLTYHVTENGGKYLSSTTNTYFMLADVQNTTVTEFEMHPDTEMIFGRAFAGCASLTSVTFSENVRYIGFFAFDNCDALESIVIPEGVERIENFVFRNCDSLKTVSLPSTATYMGHDFFTACPSIETVSIHADNPNYFSAGNCIIQRSNGALKSGCVSSVIPADGSVKRINSYAFQRVPIQSVIIPEGVVEIGSSAFYECTSLTEIEIPSTVTIIGRTAFNGCNNLQSITVAEANKVFCVKEGCLVRIEDNALLFSPSYVIPEGVSAIAESAFDGCADMKEVTIPDSVTQIGTNAFYGCTGLIEIVIPEGVIEIGNGTFRNCLNLSTVTIPVSVTKIGSSAFYSCKNLKTVYFGGTAEQWAAITVGSGNNELLNANVICQGGL